MEIPIDYIPSSLNQTERYILDRNFSELARRVSVLESFISTTDIIYRIERGRLEEIEFLVKERLEQIKCIAKDECKIKTIPKRKGVYLSKYYEKMEEMENERRENEERWKKIFEMLKEKFPDFPSFDEFKKTIEES